jgi:carboxylesterase type B
LEQVIFFLAVKLRQIFDYKIIFKHFFFSIGWKFSGVMHADEIMYLFTMPIPHNETEKELAKKMIEIWTTFATYGQVQLPMLLCTLNIVICLFFSYILHYCSGSRRQTE